LIERRKSRSTVFDRVVEMGASPFAVWAIKHIVAPVHRSVYRATGGRVFRWGKRSQSILLLTTTGRRTGKLRTTPVFFLRDRGRFVVCNVKPGQERANPWVLNLRSHPTASIQVGPDVITCTARQVEGAELDRYWPQLVALWPAYREHFERSGVRSVFVLEPVTTTGR
jgi:deazaflavin-dependent oxidoreductase (nitroreductase family)